jgi:phage gp45-like
MASDERQKQLTPQQPFNTGITQGVVVDTADPMQSGRLRVQCPAFGDRDDIALADIPWAEYVSPFGGNVQVGTRGPNDSPVRGPTSYGMWAIPKVGAQVLVMCLDGNPSHRLWLGCVYTPLTAHTMPHGRYNEESGARADDDQKSIAGPFDTFESSIEPLHTNQQQAFGEPPSGNINFEFLTRAADYQVARVRENQLQIDAFSALADDADQGYRTSLICPEDIILQDPNIQTDDREQTTKPNLDNMVTSIVSPGFHAMSMDDRPENSRMRFRTAAGHQVILDDTNERIYISTAKGNNWIEIDEAGNIDIYTSGKLSATADRDVNFKTNGSFRVEAKKGIHLKSGKEMRVQASEDIQVKTVGSVRVDAASDVRATSGTGIFNDAPNVDFRVSGKDTTVNDLMDFLDEFVGEVNQFRDKYNSHHHYSGSVPPPFPGAEADTPAVLEINDEGLGANPVTDPAHVPNRQPAHEPWARIDLNDTGEPVLIPYDNEQVGIQFAATGDDGLTSDTFEVQRNPRWRR